MAVSPQVSLAVLQFLTTTVRCAVPGTQTFLIFTIFRPFFPEHCSQSILQKLLAMDVYREVKLRGRAGREPDSQQEEGVIMQKGVACDFFVLIIEGRVEVTIGKENKSFQEGPFSCFGKSQHNGIGCAGLCVPCRGAAAGAGDGDGVPPGLAPAQPGPGLVPRLYIAGHFRSRLLEG